MSETWMVVRRSRTIPGGYRVVRHALSEDQARALAASYKRPHEAMKAADLIELRRTALDQRVVTARCVGCRATREIRAGEIPAGEVPMCETCFMPMVAVEARS